MGFQKGMRGNSGGRPRVLADVQELARQRTERAINTLTDSWRTRLRPMRLA
jgi:hypothetical protein